MKANLQDVKRYDWEVEDNHYYCADSVDGEWCKFEEAMEASSNSLQQLKAEIRAISDIITEYGDNGIAVDFPMLKRRLRELSAV